MKLESVNSFRYLGFRGYFHIVHVIGPTTLGQCNYADECVKLSLVKSFAFPLLTYCIERLKALRVQTFTGTL